MQTSAARAVRSRPSPTVAMCASRVLPGPARRVAGGGHRRSGASAWASLARRELDGGFGVSRLQRHQDERGRTATLTRGWPRRSAPGFRRVGARFSVRRTHLWPTAARSVLGMSLLAAIGVAAVALSLVIGGAVVGWRRRAPGCVTRRQRESAVPARGAQSAQKSLRPGAGRLGWRGGVLGQPGFRPGPVTALMVTTAVAAVVAVAVVAVAAAAEADGAQSRSRGCRHSAWRICPAGQARTADHPRRLLPDAPPSRPAGVGR